MTLKLGAHTACLPDRPLEAALDVLAGNLRAAAAKM
jgi:hypothetical protein